jgi:outer membrane protein TolC
MMKINYFRALIYLVLALSLSGNQGAFAQTLPALTLEEALERGLSNNNALKALEIGKLMAGLQNTKAAAGYYPDLQLNAAHTHSLLNTQLNFFDGREIAQRGAYSNNTNAGVSMVWTLFDGNRRYHVKKQLETAEATQNTMYLEEAERVIYRIALAYLNVVRQQELLDQSRRQLSLSIQRLELARFLEEKGNGTALSILQNQVNVRQDSAQVQMMILSWEQARQQLLLEMSEKKTFEFTVRYAYTSDINLEEENRWKNTVNLENTSLKRMRLEILASEERLREARSTRYPEINLLSTLNFNLSNNQANFVIQSSNLGPAVGLTLSYPIIDNGIRRRQIELSGLQKDAQVYQMEHLSVQLSSQLANALLNYRRQKDLITTYQENAELNEKYLALAEEMYRLGRLTEIEVREAQLNVYRARSSQILAEFMRHQHYLDAVFLAGEIRKKLAF